jgi:hypothetical protein
MTETQALMELIELAKSQAVNLEKLIDAVREELNAEREKRRIQPQKVA